MIHCNIQARLSDYFSSNLYKFYALLVSVFLFFILMFGNVQPVGAASLPVVNGDSNTKLLEVNGTYFYAFTSSTDSDYRMFVATSTDGSVNNWSAPVDVFNAGIFAFSPGDGHADIHFSFDYNKFGGYFGAAIIASGTTQLLFTTSTDIFSWSVPIPLVIGIETGIRNSAILNFSEDENLITVFFRGSASQTSVMYSDDDGASWTSGLVFGTCSNCVLKGAKVSGSGGSRVFHVGYMDNNSPGNYPLYYASSTDSGVSWSTTTVANAYIYLPLMDSNVGFDRLVSFDVDSDGLPGFTYYQPNEVGNSLPLDVTSTILYAKKGSNGSWSTSTVLSDVYFFLDNTSQQPSNLYFFNGNQPIFVGLGSNYGLSALVNTSSVWTSFNLSGGTLGQDSDVSSVYSTSSQSWATSFVLNDGTLSFVTTSLPTYAPSVSPIYPVESYGPIATVTTTVSDVDGSDVNLLVQVSSDGLAWDSVTILSVSSSIGTVTISTSSILGVDTSVGSNDITFTINLGGGGDYEGPAYVRVIPSDFYYTGETQTSSAFTLDLTPPTTPGNLSLNSVSTSSVILNLPSTTSTDTNFSEYKIFYSTVSPVTVTSSAFTSSSDVNLANSNFNGATTTVITGLTPSTTYYFKIFAYDIYGNVSSSVAEVSTSTIFFYPGHLPGVSPDAKTKLLVVGGEYYLSFSSTTDGNFYHEYVIHSATGLDGSWSAPVDIFNYGIASGISTGSGSPKGSFGFDYNVAGGYFGAAIYATGTEQIWFSTSSDTNTWSATTTVVSGLELLDAPREISLIFSKSENLGAVFYEDNPNGEYVKVAYTANNGNSWTINNDLEILATNFIGGGISGSGGSRVFHAGYYDNDNFLVGYASSSDNGITWTTSTVAADVKGNIAGPGDFGFNRMLSFNLDGNGLPSFIYYQPIEAGGSGPYSVTSSIVYAHLSNLGVWSTSSLSNAVWSIDNSSQQPNDLIFYDTDKPIFASLGTGFDLISGIYDSGWTTSTVTSSLLNQFGDVSLVVNTSSNIWAIIYPLSDGTLHFATSSLPSSPASPAIPTGLAVTNITTSTALASWSQGIGGNEDEFYLELYSGDGNTVIHEDVAAISNTTSSIIFLTPNTQYLFKVSAALAGVATSSVVTTSFYTSSTDPISPTVSNVSTSSLTFSWNANSNPSTTTYLVSGAEMDDQLAATTTNLIVLPNKSYTLTVRSLNHDSSFNSVVTATATTTQAVIPGTPVAVSTGQTTMNVSWSNNYNITSTLYELYNVTNDSMVVTTTATSTTVSSLTAATSYQFKVRAQYNSDNTTWTSYSANSDAVSTDAVVSSGGGGGGGGSSSAVYTVTPIIVSSSTVSSTTVVIPPVITNPIVVVAEDKIFVSPAQVESSLQFAEGINYSYQPGAKLKFNYSYQNTLGKTVNIKVVRKLLDAKKKVIKTASANLKLKSKEFFNGKVNETLAKTMKPGIYSEAVQVWVNNKVVSENSFDIQVEKLKKKYFSLGTVADENSDVNFVPSSLAAVKPNIVLPSSFNYIYTYPLSTHKRQVIRLSRDLVAPDGKVIESIPGRWNTKPGESDKKYVKQNLSEQMVGGDYQIRIRVFDDKTKALLAENSLSFNIESK